MGNPTLAGGAANEPNSELGPNPHIKVLKNTPIDQTKTTEYKFCEVMHKLMCKGARLNLRMNGFLTNESEKMDDVQVQAIEQLVVLEGAKTNYQMKDDQLEIEIRLLNLMIDRMIDGHEVSLINMFPPENMDMLRKKAPELVDQLNNLFEDLWKKHRHKIIRRELTDEDLRRLGQTDVIESRKRFSEWSEHQEANKEKETLLKKVKSGPGLRKEHIREILQKLTFDVVLDCETRAKKKEEDEVEAKILERELAREARNEQRDQAKYDAREAARK